MCCNFFIKNILPCCKMFVPLHPISKVKLSPMPHSSSGLGHLPLTQKITSSTLVCGTKASPLTKEAFLHYSQILIFKS